MTKPNVFIIESLNFDDEQDQLFEGKVLSTILNFAGVESQYYYIRTKKEFEHVLGIFKKSKYRYLHISCHGNSKGIATTLDNIPFKQLGLLLEESIDKKRLFISACSVMNRSMAKNILTTTDCYSIIGPSKDIYMDDAVIFWAAFYQLMFKKSPSSMNRAGLRETLRKLVETFDIPMKFYSSSQTAITGWVEINVV